MADQNNQQQIQLRIDESRMRTTYSNTIRTTTTPDEVVLDFGMNMPMPGQDNRPMILFDVGSRVVLNWRGAKRLAMSLGQVVRQYEQANGEIPLNPPGQNQGPGGSPKLADQPIWLDPRQATLVRPTSSHSGSTHVKSVSRSNTNNLPSRKVVVFSFQPQPSSHP
jgi:hypothetical protein